MQGFSGFGNRGRLIKIPSRFFSELLPQIDHLGEMKVTLYMFWRLQVQEERFYIWEREIRGDEVFVKGLAEHAAEVEAFITEGLERAVARGTLLTATTGPDDRGERLYLANTARGRKIAESIESGSWRPQDMPDMLIDLHIERPTVYTLYEQNIGPLTPLIAEQLRDLEETYSRSWVEDAIRKAVNYNARNIVYIAKVLETRQKKGTKNKASDYEDDEEYFLGPYGDDF
jgi:DnaD/phage-associated family protein